jgi:hypothetical protein
MANFSLLAKLGLDSKAFQSGLKGAHSSVGKFKKVLSGLAPIIGGIGLTAMARKAINAGSAISDMAVQLRIGAEQLQVLEFAARKAGVETSIMERAIRNVQLRTQQGIEGNKSYSDAYKVLGLSIQAINKLPAEKKLETIAKAAKGAKDQQAAFNAVARILGERAGPKMMEILDDLATEGFRKLAKEAKDAGEVMDDEMIRKMDDAADSLESFNAKLTVFSGRLVSDMMEGSKRIADAFKAIVEAGKPDFGDVREDFVEMAKQNLKAGGELESEYTVAMSPAGPVKVKDYKAQQRNLEKIKERAKELEAGFNDLSESEKNVIDGVEDMTEKTEENINTQKELAAIAKQETALKEAELGLLNARASGEKELAEEMERRAEILKLSLQIQKNHNMAAEDALNLAQKIHAQDAKGKPGDGGKFEEEEKLIKAKELEALELKAAGKDAQAKALEEQIELMKEAIRLAQEYNLTREEALNLARGIASAEEKDTRGDFAGELQGHALKKAAEEAGKEDGIRFERMGDGTFQQFVKGKKGGRFTEEQLQKGLEGKIEKDSSEELLEKINKTLEGKFISQ